MPNPGQIALVTGLLSSSYFTFGNIGSAYFGVMPLTAPGKTTLPVPARLALWGAFYEIAMVHMSASVVASALSLSVAAYMTPESPLRNLLVAGAAASYSIPIYTILWILPVNNDLLARLKASSVTPMNAGEEQRVVALQDKWRVMHRLRMVFGSIAVFASVTALMATDRMIWYVFSCVNRDAADSEV
ncbi:hypothetical protein DFH09DRAFT_1094128 [Mycena vulgaris]|nr:hypothetical protein DFH09DRAFT_1094128 [Mycena vulgaris]